MNKIYFVCILCCIFLISPNAYSFSDKELLPVKKTVAGNSYVTSTSDPGWSYTCKDGVEVELLSLGLKNNVPASLAISDTEGIQRIVVEIVYKGNNPGSTIDIEDANGTKYTANREVPSGGSSSVWYYRAELPATTSINYNNTSFSNKAQSMLAYVFRAKNNGIGSSGVFTAVGGYNNIETITIPITTDSGPRSVDVELPVSELTPDGRYIHIEVSASDGSFAELTENINDFPSGECCIKVFELNLTDVAGDVDEIEIKIDTRNKQNGQSVNGQSWVMGGAVKTDVKCSCVDFDTTPPTANNLVRSYLLEDISQMPEVTFSDECSDVTVSYKEYEPEMSCWSAFGPIFTDSDIYFDNFPFDKYHTWANGYFQKFQDGTAKVHGRVVNNKDMTSGWIVEIFFETLVDYDTWIAAGGLTATDALKDQRMYANIDFSQPYTFEGFGDYASSTITLLDVYPSYMDLGPRAEYGDYGMGFWAAYEGVIDGNTVTAGDDSLVEMHAALDKCVEKRVNLIVREWTVTDAAGNTQIFIQRVEFE